MISSFFPGEYSKWFAFFVNIVALALAQLVLFRMIRRLTKRDDLGLWATAAYGFSVGFVTTAVFFRMYAWLTLFVLLFAEQHISALSKVLQRQWKYSTVVENQQLIDSLSEKLNNFDFTRENGLSLLLKGTPFQTEVWENLINIPSGETRSYQDLADLIPESSARAVGGAVARNEISVILPCHRVIHNNGDIGH